MYHVTSHLVRVAGLDATLHEHLHTLNYMNAGMLTPILLPLLEMTPYASETLSDNYTQINV